MWGSSEKQVNRLFNEVMNGIDYSRDEAKSLAREVGAKTFKDVSKLTDIYSYKTAETYLPYWKNLADFARQNKGVKDIENISNRTVKEFLQKKFHDVSCKSSYAKISSAISKMEYALNRYTSISESGKSYDWSKIISNQKTISNEKLSDSISGRGFRESMKVVEKIEKLDHKLAAKIQCEGGTRISESTHIKAEQLRGMGKDPYNAEDRGVVKIQGKGGAVREIYLSPKTYKELSDHLKKNSTFHVSNRSYTDSIKEAAARAGQAYTGTHDFRHTWAQNRFKELADLGYGERQCLAGVSVDIGHVRPDITEVYLK
jgi:integrase